ncbi:MAG: hypothetical protein P4N60_10920 [Verrucomicrobiae bacterium]|nr:hypothetical protein [Verrucomicrobiae bacterium]
MKTSLFSALLVLTLLSRSARAGDLATPLTVTSGYNADLVAEGTNSAATTTSTGFDVYGAVFYDATYDASHGNHGGALPVGTTIMDCGGNTYSLAPATGNNALLIGDGDSGTLNLSYATNASLTGLSVLGTSADGDTVLDYTLNFAGGATASGSIAFSDWYDPRAYGTFTSLGCVTQDDDFNSERGRVYSLTAAGIEIPNEYATLQLESITFTYNAGNVDNAGLFPRAAILAVSAVDPLIPATQVVVTNLPASAPFFSSPAFANRQFSFTVNGTTGTNYVVLAATNLAMPDWIPVLTNSAPFVFQESSPCPQRFYRAMVAP